MRLFRLALVAVFLAAPPLAAQDILGPLQQFVEDLAPPRSAPPPIRPTSPTPPDERPAMPGGAPAASTEAAETPPLPRPRPDTSEESTEPATGAPASEPQPENAGPVREAGATPPARIYQTACPALLSGAVIGEMLPPLVEGLCGERSPLQLTAIRANGREIALSSPVTTNCAMAGALADWAGEVDAYARARLGHALLRLETGTSMMCRNRVGDGNGFMSEHGFANALDLSGLTLDNEQTIAVEKDWLPATTPEALLLRQAHGAACGRFTTVLGPEANADHSDHFHLDLGCHGQACTTKICE